MNNTVNHPSHYNQNGVECIDVIEASIGRQGAADFCMGNAIKYLYRHARKGHSVEDVQKAIWYLNKWIELNTERKKKCPLYESERRLLWAMSMIKGSGNDESDVQTAETEFETPT